DATIIWGAQLDDTLDDTIRVTVVATGLGNEKKNPQNDLVSEMLSSSSEDDGSYGELLEIFNK
ncbi:MAG: hypothetical protein IKK13_06045, partial [Clostridia bacterium]|nr:hypothetical protein [Clostridia bacterium]